MCSHVTRNNMSHNIDVPSPARMCTTYEMHTASQVRLLSAVTVRPKSLHEDVHASTGHPGYTGMQWHQKNTIGANYTDKDAASARGICQGCALGSAHQYPTNQHQYPTHPMTQANNSLWMPSLIIVSEQDDLYTLTYSLT